MKSIFERLCGYVGSFKRRSRERAPGEHTEPRHISEEMRNIRTAPGDPYSEMRKALAMTMLLG